MLSGVTIEKIRKFNEDRKWDEYHNGKDLAISLCLEAAELLEIYQWSKDDLDCNNKIDKIKEELADVFIYAIQIAQKYNLNIDEIVNNKIQRNAQKYPLDKENKF